MEGRHSASPEQRAGFFTAQYNKGNDAFGGRGQAGPTAGCKKFWFPEVGDSPLQTVSIIINICVYYFEKQEERRLMAEEGMEVGIAEGSLMRLLPAPPPPVCHGEDSGGLPGPPEDPGLLCHPRTCTDRRLQGSGRLEARPRSGLTNPGPRPVPLGCSLWDMPASGR